MITHVFRPQPRVAWLRAFCSPASRSTVSEIQATACYVAKRIDTTRLHNELKQLWSHRSVSSSADRDWLFLGFGFELGDPASAVDGVQLAVSRRGSTVLFNAAPADPRYNIDSLIADSRTAMVLAPGDKVVHDTCRIVINPALPKWSTIQQGEIHLSELNHDNVKILCSALAQTVNLQFFEAEVDRMYEIVNEINAGLEKQDYDHLNSKTLHQSLARINTISNAVVLSGLRTTMRPGSVAWQDDKYYTLQSELREEFDLEDRYDELMRKLTYINDVIKYSLEISKDNTSIMLERMIVLLIAAELALSVTSDSVSHRLFQLGNYILSLFS